MVVDFPKEIYAQLKEDIKDYRILRKELVEIMDALLDTICIDYAMKVVDFINSFSALQQSEKDESDLAPSAALINIDDSTIQQNIMLILQEAELVSRVYRVLDNMCRNPGPITGQELRNFKLSSSIFTLASQILSIPIGSMSVIGIDVPFFRRVLSSGIQGAMDESIVDTSDYKREYKVEELRRLRNMLQAYLRFLTNAIEESKGQLNSKAESQRQRDSKMEQAISKTLLNIFDPFEYSEVNIEFSNDTRSKILLIHKTLTYLEVCEDLFCELQYRDTGMVSGGLVEHRPLTNEDLYHLIERYKELQKTGDFVCRFYKVHTITNIQNKKVTQYKVSGVSSDYIAIKNVSSLLEPVAFTDKLMSLGIISNKMVYAVYVVLRSVFRDSEVRHSLDARRDRRMASTTLSKMIMGSLIPISLVPAKASHSSYASSVVMAEMVNTDTFKGRQDYQQMVYNQFEVQIERILATVLAGIRKVLNIDEKAGIDVFSPERYSKRRMCENLVGLLASDSNSRVIFGKMSFFDLELIPKEIRKEMCGDQPEIKLVVHSDFQDLKYVFGMVKEPLLHYDKDNKVLYYIPMGNFMNYTEVDEISFANFAYTYTRDRRGDNKGQKKITTTIRGTNGELIMRADYFNESVFGWLLNQIATIEQYTVMYNKPDRLFRIYSDETSYGRVYQRRLNKEDTERLVDSNAVFLSTEDIATIRNDSMFNENIVLPAYGSVEKENKLYHLREQMSLIRNDEGCPDEQVFLAKGNIAGNDIFVFDKGSKETPVEYIGRLYCPLGMSKSNIQFRLGTNRGDVGFSLDAYAIVDNPNYIGKKKRPLGINQLPNNSLYASRKVLMTILSKYMSEYNRYYNSPFALTYVFQKHKTEILTEYFQNLKLVLELIVKDNLVDFFGRILSDPVLAPVIINLLYSDAPMKGITDAVDLSINGYVIDEVLNMYLLLQKNKKMQLWYRKSGHYEAVASGYSQGFMHYQPVSVDRPSQYDIDNIVISELDFTEDNLNYDFITLEDLWGIPITSSEKTVINKSFQVYGVVKGVYKLILDNLNPQKPAEEAHKRSLCNVLRALYSLYCTSEIKAPIKDEEHETGFDMNLFDSVGVGFEEEREVEGVKAMLFQSLTSPVKGSDTGKTLIGYGDNGAKENWLSKIDWARHGVVDKDGQIDSRWVSAYSKYITQIIGKIPLKDVHRESAYGKRFYNTKIDPEYLAYVYVNLLLNDKHQWVSAKNTLFFNRVHVSGEDAGDISALEYLSDLYYTALANNTVKSWSHETLGDLYLAVLGLKAPQTAEAQKVLGSGASDYCVTLVMRDEPLGNIGFTVFRFMAGAGVVPKKAYSEFENTLTSLRDDQLTLMKYLTSFSEADKEKWAIETMQPTEVDASDEHVLIEYVNNIVGIDLKDVVVGLPQLGTMNFEHQTAIRDTVILNQLFKSSTTDVIKVLILKGQKKFEEEVRRLYQGLYLQSSDKCTTVIQNNDAFGFQRDEVGMAYYLKARFTMRDKISVNSTHPVEEEQLYQNVLSRLFQAKEETSETLINRLLSDIMMDRSIDLQNLKKLEDDVEIVAKRDAFYKALEIYLSQSDVRKHAEMFEKTLKTLNMQRKVSAPAVQEFKVEQRKHTRLYERYLEKEEFSILEQIDIDYVDFETLNDNAWLKRYKVVPKYSVRGMVRKNPYLLTTYVTHQQITGQAYSESEMEQDLTGMNDAISVKGKTKVALPDYNVLISDKDMPGVLGGQVSTKEILQSVDWFTQDIPDLGNAIFQGAGVDIAVDINLYEFLDIWYVHKLLLEQNKGKHVQTLKGICDYDNRNKGSLLTWMIDNGAKWRQALDKSEIDNTIWTAPEYQDLGRVLEVQAAVAIPKVMGAAGLKLAYDNLREAIGYIKPDADSKYVAGVFNYMALQNIMYGFFVVPGKGGTWSIDMGPLTLTEGSGDMVSVKRFASEYESLCNDFFSAIFFLQSLTFSTTDAYMTSQYRTYWHRLPRAIVTEIMKQKITVDQGLHNKVYRETDDMYRLPFKQISIEELES